MEAHNNNKSYLHFSLLWFYLTCPNIWSHISKLYFIRIKGKRHIRAIRESFLFKSNNSTSSNCPLKQTHGKMLKPSGKWSLDRVLQYATFFIIQSMETESYYHRQCMIEIDLFRRPGHPAIIWVHQKSIKSTKSWIQNATNKGKQWRETLLRTPFWRKHKLENSW